MSQCAAMALSLPGGVEGPAAGLSQQAGLKLGAVWPWERTVGRQAAPTTTGRIGTARRYGSGKRDEKVYVRNQW